MLSRAIGQAVAGLKDASAVESRRVHRRQQEQKVLKDKVVRSEKRHRREDCQQHSKGESADGSFQRGRKRRRGNGTSHDSSRRASWSRDSGRRH